MKRVLLAIGLSLCTGLACARDSGTSDRQGGQGKRPNIEGGTGNPGAPSQTSAGQQKPCDKSASSDRSGGNDKPSNSSKNNAGGGVKASGC